MHCIDIKDPPWNAVGDGVADDTAAIQGAISYMFSNFSGGVVCVPPGNYFVPGGLIMKGAVILQGCGALCTLIQSQTIDVNTIVFDSTSKYASLRDLFISGYKTRPSNTNAVTVVHNVPVILRDCHIWHGNSGLFTQGTDGYIENCFIAGLQAGIASNGANWYHRCKIDSIDVGTPSHWGYLQGALTPELRENHFTQCDFSGDFAHSIFIADNQGPQSVTVFEGCVMSSPIEIQQAKWTTFNACEIGSPSFVAGSPTSVVGCFAFTPMTISGVTKAGNINIS